MNQHNNTQKASGSLFGLALGDALGARTEFLTFEAILRAYPPAGPQEPPGNPMRVTDDTQMALAVGEALLQAPRPYTANGLEGPLRKTFIDWYHSPDNNRAPGITCLTACQQLERGMPWQQATVAHSKGCGANMRVAPVGLLPVDAVTATTRAAIAQFQAALTHGHPIALAASDLTAFTIANLAAGGDPATLLRCLRDYAQSQRTVYHIAWLGSLWQQATTSATQKGRLLRLPVEVSSPEEFIAYGWDGCLHILDRLDAALRLADRESDPCLATGDGWIAEEAFATGLLCFLLFPHDAPAAIRRAAATRGDSDSIACLTGAFAGAYLGLDAWPASWRERIEYRERLMRLGTAWDTPSS
ncbi:MAG: ADP-ribosylglycohydrolase family protein [Ktedonobacteraceae bacterium]|nr:ADP-ribosylglycohydrolase family protein [Ktedonobacteraceae bacterium]